MKRLLCSGLVVLLLPQLGARAENSTLALLTPGQFHGEEVTAQDVTGWLGVYELPGGAGSEVVAGSVRITPVFDSVTDKEGEKTGKKVEFLPAVARAPGEPLFVVKGPGVKAGKVGAFTGGEGKVLTPGNEVEVSSSASAASSPRFDVYATGVVTSGDGEIAVKISDYCINVLFAPRSEMPQREQRQRLFCTSIQEPGYGASIRWAGDLNADGVPDLLFSVSQYNSETLRLFLSGQRPQEIVSEAGMFRTTGC